ncbi:MAG: spermidine synthase [Actinomycetota bacterium]
MSFLMLFTELTLIRWSAANIVYLAYFTNFVLLASFLGIGVGFLRAGSDRDPMPKAAVAIATLFLLVLIFPVSVTRTDQRSFVGLFSMVALPIWVELPALFGAVVGVMALIAECVAVAFAELAPLDAYRLDIIGSIVGIAAFSLLSLLRTPPVVWGIVMIGGLLGLLRPRRLIQVAPLAIILIALGLGSISPRDHWSPYYKVSASGPDANGQVFVKVNNLPHQTIVPIHRLREQNAFYFDPYSHLKDDRLQNILIVGAGSGNDVAVALSEGAGHVDAVEIDPVIQGIGRDMHPDHPYQDPRVNAIVDDGRAFLQRTDQTYDLILFALPDSLTLVSGQSSLRLESYLFTLESLRTVRDHLAPDGAFAMYNYYRRDVFDRFAETIDQAFGRSPCIDTRQEQLGARQEAVLTVGKRAGSIECGSTTWQPPIVQPSVATDDHPFPYLNGRYVPRFYLITLLLILVGGAIIVRRFGGPFREMRPFADLFFMGVAFLLLETKNVVQFALFFGTTWFVNALVFAGILLSVLLAVEVARRFRLPRPSLLYGALAVSLVAAYLIPQASLLALPVVSRFFAGVGLAFAPVFLANLVFAQRFKDVASSTVAFGANLLGAMVGGVMEYVALITGYRALLIVVGVAYLAAFLLRGRTTASAALTIGQPR